MAALRSKFEQNLGGIVLTILLAGCLIVLWPFVSALLWATSAFLPCTRLRWSHRYLPR